MTIKEIYNHLVSKSDLHSVPELHNETLIWPLYKNAYIQAFCNNGDTSIDIIGNSVFAGSIMLWHPDEDDMIDELFTLGKKGNMLVLKKSLFETSTFYCGPSENFPLADRTSLHFGKKKWDGGQLIYLEQK